MTVDVFMSDILNKPAVWWRRTGVDAEGRPAFANPVEILCRWDEEAKMVAGTQTSEVRSSATVIVDRDMSEGDFLKYGEITGLASNTDPQSVSDAYEIIAWKKIATLSGTEYVREASL